MGFKKDVRDSMDKQRDRISMLNLHYGGEVEALSERVKALEARLDQLTVATDKDYRTLSKRIEALEQRNARFGPTPELTGTMWPQAKVDLPPVPELRTDPAWEEFKETWVQGNRTGGSVGCKPRNIAPSMMEGYVPAQELSTAEIVIFNQGGAVWRCQSPKCGRAAYACGDVNCPSNPYKKAQERNHIEITCGGCLNAYLAPRDAVTAECQDCGKWNGVTAIAVKKAQE